MDTTIIIDDTVDSIDAFYKYLDELQCDENPADLNEEELKSEFISNYASCLYLENLASGVDCEDEWLSTLDDDEELNEEKEGIEEDCFELEKQIEMNLKVLSEVKDLPGNYRPLKGKFNTEISLLQAKIQAEEDRFSELKEIQKELSIPPSLSCRATLEWLQPAITAYNVKQDQQLDLNYDKLVDQELYHAALAMQRFPGRKLSSSCDEWKENNPFVVVAQDTDKLFVVELFYWGSSSLLSSEIRFRVRKQQPSSASSSGETPKYAVRKVEVTNMKVDNETDQVLSMAVKFSNSVPECLPFLHKKLCM